MTEIANQGREIRYARVSKTEQHLALQLDALKKRGVIRVFTDKQTGTRFDRVEFLKVLDYLNSGDTLVMWKLERYGKWQVAKSRPRASSGEKTSRCASCGLYRLIGYLTVTF